MTLSAMAHAVYRLQHSTNTSVLVLPDVNMGTFDAYVSTIDDHLYIEKPPVTRGLAQSYPLRRGRLLPAISEGNISTGLGRL